MDVDLFGSESESKSESEVEVEVESELGNEIEMRIRISELADPRKKKGKLKCQKSSLYTPSHQSQLLPFVNEYDSDSF